VAMKQPLSKIAKPSTKKQEFKIQNDRKAKLEIGSLIPNFY
jgi:hypothetical protein